MSPSVSQSAPVAPALTGGESGWGKLTAGLGAEAAAFAALLPNEATTVSTQGRGRASVAAKPVTAGDLPRKAIAAADAAILAAPANDRDAATGLDPASGLVGERAASAEGPPTTPGGSALGAEGSSEDPSQANLATPVPMPPAAPALVMIPAPAPSRADPAETAQNFVAGPQADRTSAKVETVVEAGHAIPAAAPETQASAVVPVAAPAAHGSSSSSVSTRAVQPQPAARQQALATPSSAKAIISDNAAGRPAASIPHPAARDSRVVSAAEATDAAGLGSAAPALKTAQGSAAAASQDPRPASTAGVPARVQKSPALDASTARDGRINPPPVVDSTIVPQRQPLRATNAGSIAADQKGPAGLISLVARAEPSQPTAVTPISQAAVAQAQVKGVEPATPAPPAAPSAALATPAPASSQIKAWTPTRTTIPEPTAASEHVTTVAPDDAANVAEPAGVLTPSPQPAAPRFGTAPAAGAPVEPAPAPPQIAQSTSPGAPVDRTSAAPSPAPIDPAAARFEATATLNRATLGEPSEASSAATTPSAPPPASPPRVADPAAQRQGPSLDAFLPPTASVSRPAPVQAAPVEVASAPTPAPAQRPVARPVPEVEAVSAPSTAEAASLAPLSAHGAPVTSSATPIPAPTVTPPGASHAAIEATVQLAAQMTRRLEGRRSRFDIALTPDDLGRVDVSMTIGDDGSLSARLAFDNPVAATELRGRADELRRQLQDAGFTVAQDGLSFSGRDGASDSSGRGARQHQPYAARGAALAEAEPTVAAPLLFSSRTPSGVDLKV